LPEERPEKDSPEIPPVLRITLPFCSSPTCSSKPSLVKRLLVVFPAHGHRPRDHRRRSRSRSPHHVVQLRIVGCLKVIETPPLTKKPVPQLDHLRRPRSPLLAGKTKIGIDDPRRTLGGPIHTARHTVKTPPAAEVETPAAAERVRTGLSHSIWIFSTTFLNPSRHAR
jgi:hypothetical protein